MKPFTFQDSMDFLAAIRNGPADFAKLVVMSEYYTLLWQFIQNTKGYTGNAEEREAAFHFIYGETEPYDKEKIDDLITGFIELLEMFLSANTSVSKKCAAMTCRQHGYFEAADYDEAEALRLEKDEEGYSDLLVRFLYYKMVKPINED